MPEPITRNARTGAFALLFFAPVHCAIGLAGATLAPIGIASWLGVSFGILCLCDELGPARPLNRAGLVLFGAAFCARLLMAISTDPALEVRSELLFAFTVMGALLFWSVALMHRPHAPRAVGLFGTAIAVSALALILAAHLLVGGAALWGFGLLFAALASPTLDTSRAMAATNGIVALWSMVLAALLLRHSLRSTA